MDAIHAAVFPFDRQRPLVVDAVEGADDFLEIDIAAAQRAEVPIALAVAEFGVPAEDTGGGRRRGPAYVLHVDVEDAVAESVDELDVVHALVAEVAGVVVETKGRMAVKCLDSALGRGNIKGDFSGVNLEREFDAERLVLVEYGFPARGKIRVASLDHVGGYRRE